MRFLRERDRSRQEPLNGLLLRLISGHFISKQVVVDKYNEKVKSSVNRNYYDER